MQTKSRIARIAAALAIAVVLPLAILITMVHSGKKPLAHPAFSAGVSAANAPANVTPEQARKITEQYGRLPMSFEPNQGQKSPEVKFYSHGPGYELFLANQEAVMSVHHMAPMPKGASLRAMRPDQRSAYLRSEKISVVRMKLDGSNPDALTTGEAQLPGKVNYFIGNDPNKWHTDVPTFASVRYSAVYPGIDLRYYGNQQQLEYDFIVAPGADPKQIALGINGAKSVRVGKHGDLVLKTSAGNVTLQKPFVYQQDGDQRREVAGNYVVGADHEVRFALGAYDPSKSLTIDPVLIYSTYLGGSGAGGDFGYGIALDNQGNAWVAGWTSSTDFPPGNGLTPTPPEVGGGETAGFVTEVNPTGTAFLYSTFLGGSGNANGGDGANGIAVDTSGNVYVTGFTESADFPNKNGAYPTAPATATTGTGSAFLTALHPASGGNAAVVYSTYLGGNGNNGGFDDGYGVATNNAGKAYVTGITTSTDFPTVNSLVAAQNSPLGNAFVTEIDTTIPNSTSSVIFSSFLGGSGAGSANVGIGDIGQAITLDSAGHTYIAGTTSSTDFAPAPASGSTPCGDGGFVTAFVLEIDTTLTTPAPLFSYCYGGATGDTLANGIALAPDKTAVVVGQTFATDFPLTTGSIPGPANTPNATYSIGWVTKFAVTGTPVVPYSTFLGGSTGDTLFGVATDTAGDLYVGGFSQSADFPITQGALVVGNYNPNGAGTISKINPLGGGASDLIYASFYDGAGQNNGLQFGDSVNAVAVSSANNAYIAGSTSSAATGATPFPILNAPLPNLLNTTSMAFVAELPLTPTITIAPLALAFGSQPVSVPSSPKYVTVTNNTTSAVTLSVPPTFTGPNAAAFSYSNTAGPGGPACTTSIAAASVCTIGVIFTPSAAGAASATMVIQDSDDGPNHKWNIALTGNGGSAAPAVGLNPTTLTFAGTLIGATSAAQTVTVTNTGTGPLVFGATAITSSVANFTVASDTCSGTSVAPAATCTFGVTLAPPTGATPGATSGTIQIADNASDSPQSVTVNGTVWDFALGVPATASVNRGSTANLSVPITGLGGFAGSVGVTCASASSSIATCAVSPSSGNPGQSVTVTITGVSNVVPVSSPNGMPPFSIKQIVFAAIAMMFLFLIPMTRRTRTRLGLAAAMLVFAVVAGCSGSVKTKTTTLTITGTSGTVSHTYTTSVAVGG